MTHRTMQLGTCAMKPRAEGGVVDSKLDVYGVEGLKIAGRPAPSRRRCTASHILFSRSG